MSALRLHVRCALCGREVPLRGAVVATHRGTTGRLGVCGGSGAIPSREAISAWLDSFSVGVRSRAASAAQEAERATETARRARAEANAALAWVGRMRGEASRTEDTCPAMGVGERGAA